VITQGPFTLTVGVTLPLIDPGASSNNPATAVQLQNASPFVIEVNSGGTVLTIQSFTAQTVNTSGGGQSMSVVPIVAGSNGQTLATMSLTVVWLLAGESAPMLDGSLTAAAIFNSISGAGIAGVVVQSESVGVAAALGTSPGSTMVNAPFNLRLWNWGFYPAASGWPVDAGFTIFIAASPTYPIDSLGFGIGSSDRLAGIFVASGTPIQFLNFSTTPVEMYYDYSPA
jgi:hypothetical protein